MNSFVGSTLDVLDHFWQLRSDFKNWHAYGIRVHHVEEQNEFRAALFVESGPGVEDFRAQLLQKLRERLVVPYDPFEIVTMPPFHGMHVENKFRRSIAGRPGTGVFATNTRCGTGCPGTIGGFLRKKGAPVSDPVWLMTNHHILAEREECVPTSQVRDSGGFVLSDDIKFVPLDPLKPNKVDVAIAKILDSGDIKGDYRSISITCTDPVLPHDKMVLQKLGNATRVTSGIFIWYNPKAIAVNCRGDSFEFDNQFVISSIPNQPAFLAHGDSGSLVIGEEHPVALLCAIGSNATLPKEIQALATSPLGLANPFGTVLGELNDKAHVGPLQLVLNSSLGSCNIRHATSDSDCNSYLDKILA